MPADIERFMSHVDRFDLSREQKVELVLAVWQIVEGLVDRAFGLDSVQLCLGRSSKGDGNRPKFIALAAAQRKKASVFHSQDTRCRDYIIANGYAGEHDK